MPARSYSRSKKGGAIAPEVNALENALQNIQSDVETAMTKLKELQDKSLEIQERSPEKQTETETPAPLETEKTNTDNDTDSEEENEQEEEEEDKDKDEKEEIKLDDQSISINGFDGTVKQLKDSMKKKASQLSKNKRYKDKADSINKTLKDVNENAKNSKDVEDIVTSNTSLTFKNNNLMGGKKTVSHKKRKARRSRKTH
jgi:chromosome segregation ATPase